MIVGASLLLRLHVSRECSLWLDEAATARDAYAPWPILLHGPEREHPPLMFWLVRLATALFGRGDTGVRLISLLFGCVLLVAVDRLCLELEFSKARALIVTASLALTPFFVRHATEARQYAMAGALVTFAAVFALRLLRGPFTLRSLLGLAVCSVCAAATHFFALAYALALWGAVAVGTIRSWQLRALSRHEQRALAGVLAVSLLAFGAIGAEVVALAHFYASHSLGSQVHHHFSAPAIWQAFSFSTRPSWPVRLEAVLSALGLVLIAARLQNIAGIIPGSLAFAPLAVASVLSSGHALTPRYLFPSFVFYHLGAVTAVFGAFDLLTFVVAYFGPFARRASLLAWLVLLVPLALRLKEYPAGFGAGQLNYRGLQAYFQGARARDTALVVFVGYAGLSIMKTQYPVPHLMSLEDFEPIPGIDRYLIAEFSSTDPHLSARLGPLLRRHFELSLGQWRALRLVRLPGTRFQLPPRARLITLHPKATELAPEHAEEAPSSSDTQSTPAGSDDARASDATPDGSED
jgi:hypothetical protein